MIYTIFKKELLDTLRDRRTLIVMIVVPILLFPVIMKVSAFFSKDFKEKAINKTLVVAVVGESDLLMKSLKSETGEVGKYEWIQYKDTVLLEKAMRDDKVDLGLFIEPSFDADLREGNVGKVQMFYNAIDAGETERLENKINLFKQNVQAEQLQKLGVDAVVLNPVEVIERNIASDQEMIGKLAGGIIPYVFILFGFLGCMYPAIDLFTGEKERGTIETILTTPVSRWKIMTGKMMVVVLSGFMAAVFGILGLYMASFSLGDVSDSLATTVKQIFTPSTLISMFMLILPLVIFFAGLIIPIAIYAKSFKEAQSMASPLNFLVIFPAMVGMFPGVEYTVQTAFIPVVNVVLASKEILAGTVSWSLYAGTFVSLCVLAILSIALTNKQFGKETNISSN